jgi:hypothetical protein
MSPCTTSTPKRTVSVTFVLTPHLLMKAFGLKVLYLTLESSGHLRIHDRFDPDRTNGVLTGTCLFLAFSSGQLQFHLYCMCRYSTGQVVAFKEHGIAS